MYICISTCDNPQPRAPSEMATRDETPPIVHENVKCTVVSKHKSMCIVFDCVSVVCLFMLCMCVCWLMIVALVSKHRISSRSIGRRGTLR